MIGAVIVFHKGVGAGFGHGVAEQAKSECDGQEKPHKSALSTSKKTGSQ